MVDVNYHTEDKTVRECDYFLTSVPKIPQNEIQKRNFFEICGDYTKMDGS